MDPIPIPSLFFLTSEMGQGTKLTVICLSVILSLCYSYFISSKIPKGIPRLISLLPIFTLFTILPFHLSSPLIAGTTSFFFSWLANFKLLLFSFDQGPLSSSWPPKKTLFLFITIAALPSKMKENKTYPPKKIPLNTATETLLFAMLNTLIHNNKQSNYIHPTIVLGLYCCSIYFMVNVIVATATAIVRAVAGLELEQPSNEPYLATSLQDFWGRRWNLMATNSLRHTVSVPVTSGLTRLLGKGMATLVSVFASFVVSGLMHELIMYQVTHVPPSWEMASFFVLQGVCVVVELIVKRALANRLSLPPIVSRVLTVGFVVVTGFWLFFPPVVNNGLDVRVVDDVMVCLEYLKSKMVGIYNVATQR